MRNTSLSLLLLLSSIVSYAQDTIRVHSKTDVRLMAYKYSVKLATDDVKRRDSFIYYVNSAPNYDSFKKVLVRFDVNSMSNKAGSKNRYTQNDIGKVIFRRAFRTGIFEYTEYIGFWTGVPLPKRVVIFEPLICLDVPKHTKSKKKKVVLQTAIVDNNKKVQILWYTNDRLDSNKNYIIKNKK